MSKSGRSKQKSSRRKNSTRVWQLVLAVVVVGGLASSWILISRDPASDQASQAGSDSIQPEKPPPGLEDRMILPAKPRSPRPATLNPSAFAGEPEVQASYQAAKDVPEVLEHMACYCGCFGNSGHRNNLDCFVDSHGTGCSLCRSIALEAQRQAKLGTPVAQIKRDVDERWAPRIR